MQPLKWDSEEHRNAKWWIQDTESVLHGRRCDLPIIDGAHLSLDEYEKSIRDKHAVLLTNLTKGWKAFSVILFSPFELTLTPVRNSLRWQLVW